VTVPGASATDPSSYCNPPAPNVTIVKFTNGADANDPNAAGVPSINQGQPVTWTYRVTNTGNTAVPRAQVVVTDSTTGVTPTFTSEITGNGDTIFHQGEVWLYTATGTALDLEAAAPPGVTKVPNSCTAGGTQPVRTAYVNVGTVAIPGKSATDPSSYCNPTDLGRSAVTIKKFTNGADANDPDQAGVPNIDPGGTVTWTYVVENTGNNRILRSQVVVTDVTKDLALVPTGVTPTFASEMTGNGDNIFDPHEIWLYTATGSALNLTLPHGSNVSTVPNSCSAGGTQPPRNAYTNLGRVQVPGAQAADPSSYCNPPPQPCSVTIGDFVWLDTNLNGKQDPGEPGVPNVTVQLLDSANNLLMSTTTDGSGHYLFNQLACVVGGYQVKLIPPAGQTSTQSLAKGVPADTDSNPNPSTVFLPNGGTDLTIDFGLVNGLELCPPAGSPSGTPSTAGKLTWTVLPNGDVSYRYEQNTGINDNSYGTGSVGWGGSNGHKFSDLTSSDKAEFIFKNAAGAVVLDFFQDYISQTNTNTVSGYASLGATGGDGSLVSGSAANILSVNSSLARNLNDTGYCVNKVCTVAGVNLLTNSPPTTGPNSYTLTNPAAHGQWNFVDAFEGVIKASAFGASGFGSVAVGLIHNSPAKAGNNAGTPTVCPIPGSVCTLGYPFTSGNPRTSVVFNESETLRALGNSSTTLQMWYSDEHAGLLGVRGTGLPVSPLPSNPGLVANPLVGDQTKADPFGRPYFPSLFITDITNDPNSRAGDWQFNGTPVKPDDIFGTWKGASASGSTITVDADPAKGNTTLGPGSDPFPSGASSEAYITEARWNLSNLPLIAGHRYRFQFIAHDGDQNKAGGDVGQACLNVDTSNPTPNIVIVQPN